EADLPEDIRSKFAPLVRDLSGLGFREPIYHSIADPLHASHSYWASFVHASGQAWGRIHCRIWSGQGKDRVYLYPVFFTEFDDDSLLITTAAKQSMVPPPGTRAVSQVGADCQGLWERHGAERERDFQLRPRRIANQHELRAAVERLHGRVRDYLLDRGIFQPLSEAEQQRLQGAAALTADVVDEPVPEENGQERSAIPRARSTAVVDEREAVAQVSEPVVDEAEQDQRPLSRLQPTAPVDAEEVAVLLELERLQNTQSGALNMLLVLAASLVLFMTAWNVGQGQELLWTIIPILTFHELGHYLSMRWFGYRNVRMFFIPFLGAAVTGQHYNVPGWKKAIVALLGPVPGIFVGGILGVVGLIYDVPWLVHAAFFMEIINGFNLLPLLPLDGGWVLHAVLFMRHPVLDVAFRNLTILGLLGLGVLLGNVVLMILPGLMLLAVPVAWRIAQVAHRLRGQGVGRISPDAQTIPPETAHTILHALRAAMPRNRMPRLLAQQVLQVFETINARPPGVLASIALLAVHAVSFVASVVLAVIFVVGAGWWANRGDVPPLFENPPAHTYERGQTAVWRGPEAPAQATDAGVTLIATCADAAAAKDAFDVLQRELPRNATLRWFGRDVLVNLPKDEPGARERWLGRLRQLDINAAARGAEEPLTVRLAVELAPGAAGDHVEAELRDYLEVPNCELLTPPWAPAWMGLPAAHPTIVGFRKARRTVRRLQAAQVEAARMFKPDIGPGQILFGNQEDFRQRAEAARRAVEEEEKRLIQEIRAEGKDAVDHAMLALWEAFIKPTRDQRVPGKGAEAEMAALWQQRSALLQQMAQRMGALPLQGDRPVAGSERLAVRFGHFRKHERTLDLVITFYHAHEGLPALADWLGLHGDGRLRYEFLKGTGPDEDDT
ncbi:MAG TPA: hypothetical protein VKI65_08565, partial [Gemmataceae bacterium]|nr:hypothetical protein [Gemmataceae bacterium]